MIEVRSASITSMIRHYVARRAKITHIMPMSGRCIFVYLCAGLDAAKGGVVDAVIGAEPVAGARDHQQAEGPGNAGHGIRQVDTGRGLAVGSGGYELVLAGLTGRRWR
jgi:hypothetical protein